MNTTSASLISLAGLKRLGDLIVSRRPPSVTVDGSEIRVDYDWDEYGEEQWDRLLNPTSSVPWDLPDWFARHVGTFGLPPGHPDAPFFAAQTDAAAATALMDEIPGSVGRLDEARADIARSATISLADLETRQP